MNDRLVNVKMPSATVTELNNNSEHILDGIYRPRSESRASTLSSASSSNETSEEIDISDVPDDKKEDTDEVPDKRRFRSMSDGSPSLSSFDEPYEVFPSLPDSVLEKMGLLGDCPKERLNDEESEQKFVALALAFSIDATTIKARCQRQRRYRDQTEKNLSVEIDRLIHKAQRMQTLCVDAETTELLRDLLTQITIVMRASIYSAISAERFGAVQHEDRLAQAVEIMIKHVTLLKQQRDSARKHLQYTKRMLQNTNNLTESQTLPKAKAMHSRRASIANINQPPIPKGNCNDFKRIARRTSEMSIRASALPRLTRPSRLELGVDLVKIREVTSEGTNQNLLEEAVNNEQKVVENLASPNTEVVEKVEIDVSSLPLRQRISFRLQQLGSKTSNVYKGWCDTGTIHEMFTVATLMCFSLSVITLGNILIELECAKHDSSVTEYWSLETLWTDFLPFLTNNYEKKEVLL